MKLIAFLNNKLNEEFRRTLDVDFGGYANGYVAVPPEHPYYGVLIDNLPIGVHGGVSFSGRATELSNDGIEFLGNDTVIPDDYWVFGFDTMHIDDNLLNWPRERCAEETLYMKEQLEQL